MSDDSGGKRYTSGSGGEQRARAAGDKAPGKPAPKGPDAPKQAGGVGGCLVVVAVLAAIGWGLAQCGADSEPSESLMQIQAEDQCQDWVKEKLKAPATADFSDGRISGTDGDYTIVGNVDSENSFGAKIRSTWTCTITRAGDNVWTGDATVNE